MGRKITALALLFVLVITSLSGCSNKNGQINKEKNGKQENNKQEEQLDYKSKSPEMGRFMESKISFPDLKEGERVVKIIRNQENQIEVYTYLKKQYLMYQLKEDKTWENGEAAWLNDGRLSGSNVEFSDLCLGEDGNYYAVYIKYSDKGYGSHIIKSKDKKAAEEIKFPYLKEGQTYKDYTIYPRVQKIAVTKNGDLVFGDDKDSLLIFSKEGEKLAKIPAAYSEDTGMASFAASENDVITVTQDKKNIIFYNTGTKETEKTVPYDASRDAKAFAVKKDGTVFVGDRKGIHRLAKDGSLWETTVDGVLNSMSMPSLYFDELFVSDGDEEQYYASYADNDGGYRLLQYVFDKNVSAVPAQEITVYSLKESNTIRQAASLFQAENADIRVNYVVAMGEEGGTVSDYIRALNTELLAGNGADVLVLDGLPVDSYVEKGVLADITDIIKPLEESGELLTNISSCYQQSGKIYQMPTHINVPIVVGREDGILSMKDMDSILSYMEKEKKVPYGGPTTYKALLQDYLALYAKDLYVDGKPDKERITAFLEKLKKIADNRKAVEYLEDGRSEAADTGDNFIDSGLLLQDRAFLGLIKNKYSIGVTQIGGIFQLSVPCAISEQTGLHIASINQHFIPEGLVGLNNSGANKEIAKEFIGFLFTKGVQDTKVLEGFPVNSGSLDKWMAEESSDTFAMSDGDGNYVDGDLPDKEEREYFKSMIKELNSPIEINRNVYGIIIQEALPYFTGKIDAQQAAAAVYSKLSTYLAE
ncbi:ABC transporter substrate-binding protein [Anaerocolumna xylanovorans]|uniref:ABC-type glycerol-3-phosphate transport system, substrate-binding protein n=1 Tax=Anaerocolumna xylanovorans DSM 12503 TaxID=1121345 RepID=A0A1M7YNP8_9FIRM|nr:ABC transporter substrate-binding protein [Anaerocolumna xylanovorans]SHO54217.1 ABC-type glycerol-3-phosphate transport system, substrate-binding protein [Anaerocolumna xylanovorans DSM 12503]